MKTKSLLAGLLAGATVLGTGCGRPGSALSATTASDTTTCISTATVSATSRLGSLGEITGAKVLPAPVSALQSNDVITGSWLSVQSNASDYVSQERARWISGILISEVWKVCHEAGDDSLLGGSLAPMTPNGAADGAGVNLTFSDDMRKIMFTAQDGVTPSKLVVSDQKTYTSMVTAAAQSAGLSVTGISFSSSDIGTIVQISELASDPRGFLSKYPNTNPGLTLDPSDVEGVMLVVYDTQGKIVKTSAWSTGSQSGEGGPGPDYGDFVDSLAGAATTTATR